MKIIFFLIFSCSSITIFSQHWRTVGHTSNQGNAITSFYIHDKKLYTGGIINDNPYVYCIGTWDSIQWDSISARIFGAGVSDIIYYNNKMYFGGDITLVQGQSLGLASWNGYIWDTVGNNVGLTFNENAQALKGYKNKLFAGGSFGTVDSLPYGGLAYWNDTVWNGFSSFNMDYGVECLEIYNNELIVGGNSANINGVNFYSIAAYNGSTWSDVGGGTGGYIMAMEVDTLNNFLYVGGYFGLPTNNGIAYNIACWDGYKWTCLAGGINCDPNYHGLTMYHKKLFVGGCLTLASGLPVTYMANWNGEQWASLAGAGISGGYTGALKAYKDELYIGGGFTHADTLAITNGLVCYYEPPDTGCAWFQPRVQSLKDTVYLGQQGQVEVQFQNNNAYASTWQWSYGDTTKDILHTFTGADIGTVAVQVTVTEDGCTKTASKNIVVLLGTNTIVDLRLTNADLRIFPNPSSGSVTIEVTGVEISPLGARGNVSNNNTELRITDPHGKIIKIFSIKEPNSKTEINTKSWAKGAYLCSLVLAGKTVKVEKLVIE